MFWNFGNILKYFKNISKYFKIFQNISKYFKIFQKYFKFVSKYFKISQVFSKYLRCFGHRQGMWPQISVRFAIFIYLFIYMSPLNLRKKLKQHNTINTDKISLKLYIIKNISTYLLPFLNNKVFEILIKFCVNFENFRNWLFWNFQKM